MHPVVGLVLALTTQTAYDTVYEQVKGLTPQLDAVAAVTGLVLRRDAMELRLDSGSAYLLTPVAGRIRGVVFTGRGSMSFVPPLTVEQFNLQRVMGDSTINGPITAAVVLFADSTQAELVNNVSVASEQPEPLTVDAHDIDASIDGNYNFSARVTERLIGRQDRQQWADFALYSELKVDSVTTDNGTPLSFYRRDRQSELWVRFSRPVAPGDTVNVRFVYHGGLIGFGSALENLGIAEAVQRSLGTVLDSWAYIKSTSTWYPRYSFSQIAPFAMTFHTPKNMKFATIGRLVDSSTTGNVKTTRWASELPTRHVSFNIGKFDELDIRDSRIPPVTVQVNTEAHQSISRVIPSARNPEEFVGGDVARSLAFFSRMYGAPLFKHYFATEIPYYHGQAFPGMIHLSWITFLGISTDGEDEIFRAHEMAHQWWGIGVEPAGYRDAWLSEGFAEFSGMWYMQMARNSNEKYMKALRRAREDIRRERGK